MSDARLAILTEGLFDDHHAKTAHGVIRYGTREVVAVVDSTQAGRTASEVMPFCQRPVPIVATLAEAAERGADTMLIGIAPTGGKLDSAWRALVLEAIELGLNVEAGLHTILSEDPEFSAAAERRGVTLRDLRLPPDDLGVPRGPNGRHPGLRVVHSVGSDVAIGKKAITFELDMAARGRGIGSVYVPTGQTGIAIAGWGIAVDHVLSDYVSGAAERLVDEAAERGELLFVEGQGSLIHPAYSAVTLGLLHGSSPDVLVLAHKAGATAAGGLRRRAPAAGRADRHLRGRLPPAAPGTGRRRGAQHRRAGRRRRSCRRGGHRGRDRPRGGRPGALWPGQDPGRRAGPAGFSRLGPLLCWHAIAGSRPGRHAAGSRTRDHRGADRAAAQGARAAPRARAPAGTHSRTREGAGEGAGVTASAPDLIEAVVGFRKWTLKRNRLSSP